MPRTYRLLRVGLLVLLLLPVVSAWAQGDDVVSTVNGDTITRTAFHARMRFVRWQYLRELDALYEATGGQFELVPSYVQNLLLNLEVPDALGDAVLQQLEEERLLWQTGEELGVIPTAEDAQAQEDAFFSAWTDVPIAQLATNQDAQTFIAEWYAGAEAASGLSVNDIRIVFETEALRVKLFQHLSRNVPAEELAANTRHILCGFFADDVTSTDAPTVEQREAAEACITEARIRLANGEAFGDVARLLSTDPGSATGGGELGWTKLSYLVEPYAEAVREAPLNTVVGPVETVYGLHLVEVLEREMEALTEDELEESQQGYFTLWVEDLWAAAAIERSEDWSVGLPTTPGLETLDAELLTALDEFRIQSD